MAEKKPCLVVTFPTTSDALGMEGHAKKCELEGKLAPIPRQLSAGCGFSWIEPAENEKALLASLESYDGEHEEVARLNL